MSRFSTILELILEKEIRGKSVFVMADVDKIVKMDLEDAKSYIQKKLEGTKNLTTQNKAKIMGVIRTATTPAKLGISISNFILAHPGEGLKAIKPGDK